MDSEIIAFSPPPGASDEEAAEGASRVGQIGGRDRPLGRDHAAYGATGRSLKFTAPEPLPNPSSPNRTDGIAQPDVSTSPVEPTHVEHQGDGLQLAASGARRRAERSRSPDTSTCWHRGPRRAPDATAKNPAFIVFGSPASGVKAH